MDNLNRLFDEFDQLNFWVQITLILSIALLIALLVVLFIVNPAAGVAVTGFLIALKGILSPKDTTDPKSQG
jgi:phosphatidylserine synthase